MKLSVYMTTYNHERYIEQAVTSVLAQETNFDYEIVIGEDCSTDRTRELLLALQQAHPAKIRLLLPEHNLGPQRNFIATYQACTGDYVAYLEGDDFWTSTHKLQAQVDFLDAHPECAFCFHRALVLREDAPAQQSLIPEQDFEEIASIDVLFGQSNPIATCSVVARNHLIVAFPDWLIGLKLGDWPLHILNAQHGKLGYLPEVMASYRQHANSAWSSLPAYQTIPYVIAMFTRVNEHLNFEYNAAIERTISELADYWAWILIGVETPPVGERVVSTLVDASDQAVVARLFAAVITKASAITTAKAWLEEQYTNWMAEAKRCEAQIDEQRAWVAELERSRGWLEGQRANWQNLAQQHEQALQEQQNWIAELEQRAAKMTELEQRHRQAESEQCAARIAELEQSQCYWQAETERLSTYLRRLEAHRAFRLLSRLSLLPRPFDTERRTN